MNQESINSQCEDFFKLMRESRGVDLAYDEESVAWIEDYVEGFRVLEEFQNPTPEFEYHINKLFIILSVFYGECMCRQFEGQWIWDEDTKRGSVAITEPSGVSVFLPFGKMARLFRYGVEGGESILGFFRHISAIKEKGFDYVSGKT